MKQFSTVGFIGFGNMAQAIAQGLINAGACSGEHMVACSAHYDKCKERAQAFGIQALADAREVAQVADLVIVAIKPYQISSVIGPLSDVLSNDNTAVLSIAAGWDLDKYMALFGDAAANIHIQCTIPNTPMAVGKGVLIAQDSTTFTAEQSEGFESLFSSISLIERVDADHMGIAMCIAGCAPAFTDMYLEALGDAGVKYGLQRATAYRLAAKMIEGVGALYLQTGTHPGAMKDAVCSPGGTTIKGVASLEAHAFRGAVIEAVDAIEQS